MAAIDQLESKLGGTEGRLHHTLALLTAMGGSPAGWEYTGEVLDAGKGATEKCECGHPIRYIFPIVKAEPGKPEKTLNIGSTCINSVLDLDPALGQSLQRAADRLKEEIKEKAKAAKKAAQAEAVDAARIKFEAEYKAMHERYDRYKKNDHRAPYSLWQACDSRFYIPSKAPRYSIPKAYIAWYEKQIRAIDYAMTGDPMAGRD